MINKMDRINFLFILGALSATYFVAEVVPRLLQRQHLASAAQVAEVAGIVVRTEGRLLQLEGHGLTPFRLSDDSPIVNPGEVVALKKMGEKYHTEGIWGIYEGRKTPR